MSDDMGNDDDELEVGVECPECGCASAIGTKTCECGAKLPQSDDDREDDEPTEDELEERRAFNRRTRR